MSLVALAVIPARLASTRLPRKALREIAGRPLVARVWDRVHDAPGLAGCLVATDSEEIAAMCRGLGIPSVMTSPHHPSGTDRIWEVAQSRPADVYVNIQGDEPLVTAGHVERLLQPFRSRPDAMVSTLCIRAREEDLASPTVNKLVRSVTGRALYFSKYPIPYDRDGRGVVRWKHPGFYAYTGAALDAFHRLPPSPLELTEGLEQLRFLEHGIPIDVVETEDATIGVDTEEDLKAVEAWLAAHPA